MTCLCTGWAKKPDCFWELITLQQSGVESVLYVKSFLILSRKKYKAKMPVKLNIFCIVCINIQRVWNYAEFETTDEFYSTFSQTNSESNNNGNWHKQLVQTKFNMGTPRLDNHRQSFNCRLIAQFNVSRLCSARQSISTHFSCMKFCDDTPSVAMPHTE